MFENSANKKKTVNFRGSESDRLTLKRAALDLGFKGNVQSMLEAFVFECFDRRGYKADQGDQPTAQPGGRRSALKKVSGE